MRVAQETARREAVNEASVRAHDQRLRLDELHVNRNDLEAHFRHLFAYQTVKVRRVACGRMTVVLAASRKS
jgi:hypothetical protein